MDIIEEALKRASDTKALFIGEGAIEKTPEMFKQLFGEAKAIVVADQNTWKVAGEDVQKALSAAGIQTDEPFIFTDPELYAEWSYLIQLEERLKATDAMAVAVGSGVINDLTKLASHHLGKRYIIVGTAASMDGYTAYGASVTFEGNKQTFDCRAPFGALIEPKVSAEAPKALAASGYADLIAKVPAGADWILAEVMGVEPVDQFSFDLVQLPLRESLSKPDAVFEGDVESTRLLAEGLIMSGFAMQALQSSRPASGTEHQFSHYWDMEGLCYEGKHVSHGFKVGIGTLVSTACLEFLLSKDIENLDVDACVAAWPSWEKMQEEIHGIFDGRPGHLSRALTESKNKYCDKDALRKQLEALKANWPETKERIKAQIMTFDEVKDSLKRVHAPYEPEMIGVSREKLKDTFRGIPFMRSRFTGMDVLYRCGFMAEVTEKLFGKGGYWEI